MFNMNPLAGAFTSMLGNGVKNTVNWIDDRIGDVPIFSNPYRPKAPAAPAPSPTPKPSPSQPNISSADSEWMRSMQAQFNALAARQAADIPKLPQFNTLANYTKAKQTATEAVTPLYNQKLNLFLEGQGIKKTTKTKEKDLSLENNNIALNNALQDNTISRTRTGEDLANALAAIGTGRENFLVDDAQAFDQSRRALQEEVAAGGATDTGLGQQAIGQQQVDRNRGADRQMTEFQNQEAAKQMLATRTFDDLAISDTRTGQKKTQDDKAVTIDFDGYIASLANDEQSYRLQNDLEKALAIAQQTETYEKQGMEEFYGGLTGQGWRPQDIALAKQIYG